MKLKFINPIISMVLFMILFTLPIETASIIIPESIPNICYYTDFFYNLPDQDFIYYFNDRLLFSDPPNERLFDSGIRNKLLSITFIHRKIKQFLENNSKDSKLHLTIDVSSEEGIKKVEKLMGFLGLELRKKENNQYEIMINSSIGIIDYYRFSRLDIEKIERQINTTKRFYIKLEESSLPIPWDFRFLEAITGLQLDTNSFFETLLKDERFSLLLSILYRLSEAEVDYISSLQRQFQAWRQIYNDKKLMIGLFVLSHALRVKNQQLVLPGGDESKKFWSELTGRDISQSPFEFIKEIATKDAGKLNYLYVFSFFLPENSQKILLNNFDASGMTSIYNRISLTKNASIQSSRFPRLSDFNFFTLLYALKIKDEKIYFPGDFESWISAIGGKVSPEIQAKGNEKKALQLFNILLENTSTDNKNMTAMQKFISLYSKFIDRPELMTRSNIIKLYQNYEKFNIMVDFIEKLPLKNPEVVSEMIDWVNQLAKIDEKDRILFTSIYQSFFEIFSHQAKFDPKLQDYDRIISELIKIPFSRSESYDRIFDFIKNEMKVFLNKSTIDSTFVSTILKGIPNQYIKMNNRKYEFLVQDSFQKILNEIIQSQEVCPLSTLVDINSQLEKLVQTPSKNFNQLKIELTEAFNQLPHPEISDNAPRFIVTRIKKYQKSDFEKEVQNLIEKTEKNASDDEKNRIVTKIKSEYLIHHLQEYLLTLTYALNAKNERLRIFLNPNLTRLHDFEDTNGDTPWNHCTTPKTKEKFEGFYFKGGLSRLNIELTQSWADHLFSRNIIYDQEQIQSVILNILEMYPAPSISESQTYIALLTEFGLELIQKAKNNEMVNQDILKELRTITTGYHYRKMIDFLNNKSNEYYLFFSEIFELGERFLINNKYLNEFSAYDKLGIVTKTYLNKFVQKEIDHFGGIYYYTFGNLKPRWLSLFPQEISSLFDSNWIGGEIINEFKIKTAYHAHKKMLPPKLMGEFLIQYLYNVCRKYFSQNYIKDYYSTFFIFDIMNNSHLLKIVQKLQEKGQVRLK